MHIQLNISLLLTSRALRFTTLEALSALYAISAVAKPGAGSTDLVAPRFLQHIPTLEQSFQ